MSMIPRKTPFLLLTLLFAGVIASAYCFRAQLLPLLIVPCYADIPAELAVPEPLPPAIQETIPETVPETVPEETLPPREEPAVPPTEETTPERISYTSVPLFYQTDYPDVPYGKGTVKTSGCGITSVAMVASYLTGHEYTPDVLAGYFGDYGSSNLQRLEYASDMLQLPWKKAKNVKEVFSAVKKGDLAIVLVNESSGFTTSGHFIVVTGVTEDGKYLINDPYKPNYTNWILKKGFQSGFPARRLIEGYSGGWIYDVDAMPEEPFIYTEEP